MPLKVPPSPTGKDWQRWAQELVNYLTEGADVKRRVDPQAVLLAHKLASGPMVRASVDGLLLFDPALGVPIYSVGGAFVPISGSGGVSDGDKGDITVSASGATWTIDAGAVTLAKMANIATDSFIGRDTAGTGVPEVLSAATARTILNVADGATSNASDASLRDRATHTGTQLAATISDFDTAVAANSVVAANTAKVTNATHTGDVTGATALTIANDAVTYAKMQNVSAASRLVGRGDSGAGDPEEITLGSGLSMTGTTLSATASGGAGILRVPFHAAADSNVTLTNQANAEQFLGNSNRNITMVDLADFTEYRLHARVVTGSVSVNSPRLYAEYHTSFTTTVATYSQLGTSAVNVSLTTAGHVATAWTPLAVGAIADGIFLTVLQHGGDGAADPAVAQVVVEFR